MKTHVQKLFIVLPLALLLAVGTLAGTSGFASVHALTKTNARLQGITAKSSSASTSDLAVSTQSTCSWWSIPNAPSRQNLVVQYVAYPKLIAAIGDISASPPIAVFYTFNGALPWSVVEYNSPGYFLDIYFGYQFPQDQAFNSLSALICSDWKVSYYS